MTVDKRRIDACLKACEGISTQNLEDNVPFLELARRYNVVLRERDAAELMSLALRAKIAEMEQQKPVAFALYSGWSFKAAYHKEHEACDQRDRRQLSADIGGSLEAYGVVPLYALPGAQPAPSVPDDELAEFSACQGAKCGCIDGYSHSPECVVEAAACQGWLNTPEAVDALLKVMVDRFLGWKLPKDFAPDCHVHFDREAADAFVESWPSGTNLLHAGQAMEMFKHCLPAELIISERAMGSRS